MSTWMIGEGIFFRDCTCGNEEQQKEMAKVSEGQVQ